MIDEKIKKFIKEALVGLSIYIDEKEIELEHPADFNYGDYSTNLAMVQAKKMKENPIKFAEKIAGELTKNKPKEIEKIEVAGGGFINFYLSKDFFADNLKEILKKDKNYGRNNFLKRQKTIVEFTDPNPFKEFHIGHLMSNTTGEAIARLMEWNGAKLKRANYQGDVGLHIAKVMWAMEKQNITSDKINITVLSRMYMIGTKAYKENETAKKEINEINKKIYENSDDEIEELYKKGRKISLDYFETIYKKLGTKFDYYFFESNTGKLGKEIVNEYLKKGIFEKSDGAIIFKGEKYGLHTRVFQSSDGLPTYEAKELGLSKIKYRKYKYQKSIVITGNEINEYFKVLLKVMSLIFPKLAERTLHIGHGMMRLPKGKMSSRTGDVITAEFVLGEVSKKIMEVIEQRNMAEEEKNKISEIISIGAIKYSILKQKIGKDIIFDFDKSISFEGDSGPYLQYTCVRAESVIEKAKANNKKPKVASEEKEITKLERMIYKFPEMTKRAGEEYSPHYIVTYLIELAAEFNAYYSTNKIIGDDKGSQHRLAITKAVSIILKNGLEILGIKVPEKM